MVCLNKTRQMVIKTRLLIGSLPILTALLLLPFLRAPTCEEYSSKRNGPTLGFSPSKPPALFRDIRLPIEFEQVRHDTPFFSSRVKKTAPEYKILCVCVFVRVTYFARWRRRKRGGSWADKIFRTLPCAPRCAQLRFANHRGRHDELT